jgi:hypothetical protein
LDGRITYISNVFLSTLERDIATAAKCRKVKLEMDY